MSKKFVVFGSGLERAVRRRRLDAPDRAEQPPVHRAHLGAPRDQRIDLRQRRKRRIGPQPARAAKRRQARALRDAGPGENDDVAIAAQARPLASACVAERRRARAGACGVRWSA
jgi:hypothetical protein